MTSLFHVVKFEDIPYEKFDHAVVCTTLDLDSAIQKAEEVLEKDIFDKFGYRAEEESGIYIADFRRIAEYASKEIFKRKKCYGNEQNVFIVEVKAGELISLPTLTYKDKNVIWQANDETLFKIFNKHLDLIMVRDNLDMLPESEKTILWDQFKKDKSFLSNVSPTLERLKALGCKNRRLSVRNKLELNMNGADIWAMTSINKQEEMLYKTYEA
jgi:hypothetical protein